MVNAAIATPAWCADAWFMHQIFRQLGFAPEHIYFDCHDTLEGGPNCALVSVTQGELEFIFNLGRVQTAPPETQEIWANFVSQMNAADDATMKAILVASKLDKGLPRMELILRLIDKGFELPGLSGKEAALLRKMREKRMDPQSTS